MEDAYKKLIRYAKIDTKADDSNENSPSSPGQWELLRLLEEEMKEMGLEEINLDENGYLFASLPANVDKDLPVIGFLAHVDTALEMPGACDAQVLDYQGGDIPLGNDVTMTVEKFPILDDLVGEKLILTQGDSLLGADNKAGIANILAALEYLQDHPEIPHGKIRVGFTPDEEIGRGPHLFDVDAFDADFAYTIDGGLLGELEYESFNAAAAKIHIKGESIHPGTAKNKMVHAAQLAMELNSLLPVGARPELTEGYEGFFMLTDIQAGVTEANMSYIIRDHDKEKFQAKKELMENIINFMAQKHGDRFTLQMEDSYYNMADVIKDHMELVDAAAKAMEDAGIEPLIQPIRGGTDGSQLSYMGLPCPNIFTGSLNHHGAYEFAVASWMDKSVEVIVGIVKNFAETNA